MDESIDNIKHQIEAVDQARQILQNINEGYEAFKLGIYLNARSGYHHMPLVTKLSFRSDIVLIGPDKAVKHRYGPTGSIGERNRICYSENCGECEACINLMRIRLATYEAKYGMLENDYDAYETSVDNTLTILDDSLTLKR